MRNFMLINSMRTASRAFDVGLRAQGFKVPARLKVDKRAKAVIEAPDRTDLLKFGKAWPEDIALVLHAVRPILLKSGFTEQQVLRGLGTVRDCLDLQTVYIPYRDPEDAVLSEFNRARASLMGNWRFSDPDGFWAEGFDVSSRHINRDRTFSGRFIDFGHARILKRMNYWPGTIRRIFDTFVEVFPESCMVPYEAFVRDPDRIYEQIAGRSAFEIKDRAPFHLRLNGLANRLARKNPIRLNYRDEQVQLFVEMAAVIPHTQDMDRMVALDMDLTGYLPVVREKLGAALGLCIGQKAWNALSPEFQSILKDMSPDDAPVKPILRAFDADFAALYGHYRENTFEALPGEISDRFRAHMVSDADHVRDLLDAGRLQPLIQGTGVERGRVG
ncbi:hypothetical protein EU805_15825 [Salipiger sp. IMCC34102]|uniref:hypothetical protein n=1 Tax=Salipiger sp. IMCC34102 TaxID=2510647 RepID=UPI00101BA203|nr:hypothetical protein [Salipiger sp. IMCC34102]RYH01066.1 hypothetical protein EU805_15825 [Salipiger sp. IMCC34102]